MAIRYITESASEVVSALDSVNTFSIDLETTGLNPLDSRIILCQIGLPECVYVINVNSVKIEPILPYLRSVRWRKIIQNSKFERRFFLSKYGIEINNVFDTQLAEKLINPDEYGGASLKTLALKYANVILNKDIRRSFFETKKISLSSEQIEYAAKDAEILWPIREAQEARLAELGMTDLSEIEFDLSQVVASMEEIGVPIDQIKWRKKIKDYEILHEESRLRMHDILFTDNNMAEQLGLFSRDAINLNSPKQIKEAFAKIGIDVDATNEREIALINNPATRELLVYRGLQKILSSYGPTFLDKIHPFTQRIHADFQQIGTETGRFSCKEPNLQQMPDEFRQCVTLKDHAIVGADYANIELRILAELSGDTAFMSAFTSGDDPHKSTASMMFKVPIDSVTKEQRFIAKTINFGISYGMGVGKLMDILNTEAQKNKTPKLTFPQVQDLLTRYHKTYNKASRWLAETANFGLVNGYSTTMMGRRRFYTRPDPNTMNESDYKAQTGAIRRKAANSPIQGTNADITKLAMLNMHKDLKEGGYQASIILQVHDEIVVLAHKRQSEAVKSVVMQSMKQAAESIIKTVPIKTDAYISDVWRK